MATLKAQTRRCRAAFGVPQGQGLLHAAPASCPALAAPERLHLWGARDTPGLPGAAREVIADSPKQGKCLNNIVRLPPHVPLSF